MSKRQRHTAKKGDILISMVLLYKGCTPERLERISKIEPKRKIGKKINLLLLPFLSKYIHF